MNQYLKGLSKKEMRKVIKELIGTMEPLGTDADVRFIEADEDDDLDDRPTGFYCSHTGENLLDR